MTNVDSLLKSRDITLPTKVRLVKAMVFPVARGNPACRGTFGGPSNEHPGLISFRMDWLISLQSKGF